MHLPQRIPHFHRGGGSSPTGGDGDAGAAGVADGRATPGGPSGERLGAVLVAASACIFMVQLDFFALTLALPRMSGDLGVSVHDLQWVLSGYMLALAAFLIPGGRLGDLLGRRRVLIGGVALFAVSSAICGAADSAGMVIGFRILQGIGAGTIFPVSVAIISNAFPEERRARAIGYFYGLAAVATAIGPFAGGFFTEVLTWRWVFFVNVPLSLVAVVLLVLFVRDSRDETVPRRIDFAGLLAVVGGIAAVTFAVDNGESWGWLSATTIAVAVAGLLLIAAFAAIERRVRFPLVDMTLFQNRPYVMVTLIGAIGNLTFGVTAFTATIFLQQVKGFSPIAAGAVFLAASLALAAAGPLAGAIGERYRAAPAMLLATVLGACGLVAVALDPVMALYLAGLAACGLGFGISWSLVSIGTQAVIPVERAGAASGVTLAVVIGLAGLGIAVTSAVLDSLVAAGSTQAGAIEAILLTASAGAVVSCAALALAARRDPARKSPFKSHQH